MFGYLIAVRFSYTIFFWLCLVGAIAAITASSFRLRVRFYEVLESFVIAILPWLSFVYLLDSVVNSSFISFLAFLGVLVFIYMFYLFDVNYKSFVWYKSGKIGFAGLATLASLFLVRFVLAIFKPVMLSFVGKFEPAMSGVALLAVLVLLLLLSKSE